MNNLENYNPSELENEYNIPFSHDQEEVASQTLILFMIFGVLFFIAGVIFWALFGEPITQLLKGI